MAALFLLSVLLVHFYNTQGLCPDQWTQYHGSCYFLFEDNQEWAQANFICKSHSNGHLVTIETAAEGTYLENYVRNHQVHRSDVWIGANDIMTEGDFRWTETDHKVTYQDWTHGQPGHNNRKENCVQFRADFNFHWNDMVCSERCHYICETSPDDSIVG